VPHTGTRGSTERAEEHEQARARVVRREAQTLQHLRERRTPCGWRTARGKHHHEHHRGGSGVQHALMKKLPAAPSEAMRKPAIAGPKMRIIEKPIVSIATASRSARATSSRPW
jgi:hypothetical protein